MSFKKGLTLNELKLIAVVAMIIDHIAYYNYFFMSDKTYLAFRIIGRIAMPIFAYAIVEGYFHTKNIKKYVIRLFILAIITQVVIDIVAYFNTVFVPEYTVNIYNILNIVFSFLLSLIIIISIDSILKFCIQFKNMKNKNEKTYKTSKNERMKIEMKLLTNIVIYFFIVIISFLVYQLFEIDYGYIVPIIIITGYICKKIYIYLENKKKNIKYISNYIVSNIPLYIAIIIIAITSNHIERYILLSIIFICLYNSKKGNMSKKVQKLFYYIFPLQHLIIYSIALFGYMNIM